MSPELLHRQLVSRALNLGLSLQDAEDVVQDIWLKLANRLKLNQVLALGQPGAYLNTMVTNEVRKAWRDQQRVKRGGGSTALPIDDLDLTAPTPPPDRQLELSELRAALTAVGAKEQAAANGADRVRQHRQRLVWRQQLTDLGFAPRYSRPRP